MTTKKTTTPALDYPQQLSPIVHAWILTTILDLGGHREFIHKDFFSDDQLATAIGLDKWLNCKPPLNRADILKTLRDQQQKLLNDPATFATPYNLDLTHNLDNLKALIHLSDVECALLEFTLITYNEPLLNNALDQLGAISSDQLNRILAFLLQKTPQEIQAALSSNGALARTGLMRVHHGPSLFFRGKIDLLSRNFIEAMFSHETTPYNILKDVVSKSKPAALSLDNFGYLNTELNILVPYLQYALDHNQKGVNILIYGEPGTGKTELARTLVEHFKVAAYEVVSESIHGEGVEKGEQRLYAYLAAQNFFCNQKSLIIFDEIEDVFFDAGADGLPNFSKAWFNHILETNQIPTIWICNDTYDIDPAIIRRFDFTFHLASPPKSERKAMLESALKGKLSPNTLNTLALSKALVPAIIDRTAKVLNTIYDDVAENFDEAATTIINGTLKAQGNPEIRVAKIGGLSDIYNPAFTNTDSNLALLAERLKVFNEARICLYGASGTGKSAFAHYLADYLNKPLLIKKVSDLMDKYVGETEKQIAEAFYEATTTGAILLMDEVDSFLRDRRSAQQNYEITMVNEMLTQMEEFSGIFIATTNLMDHLDQAMLRRFDFKVKFDYLKADQAWLLFNEQCRYLGFQSVDMNLEAEFKKMTRLTPGDFAISARQAKLGVITTPEEIITQLVKENKLKESKGTTIGFVQNK
ncbi:AAA family ATPase [Wohlfahrtiimonas chitiniclastica]|uniref:AAA family ATPase n=1 Tax=Wohlfahrtiimonas chitiniclastica TaxID=400946 RepID=UPI0007B69922|nr:ATP-binding protein [Wohlfahrtiimonas chitiniclastica]KZX37491.1 hypothetical protein A6V30_00975 [Wohlfahrtiimonas chitiniclastica]